ncbi:MAG: valine--tRNA ligase [Actinobacteria bacterium]|nr:valine--tRNA ligase [Actinomycetota bacterium]
MIQETLPKVYNPHEVEAKWYKYWEENNYFRAKIERGKRPFTIVIPPPNITGSLHMGHALNNTLQDIVIRKHRMQGDPTLWLPGTDHAGIATQNVVERQLAQEGLTRQDIGRQEFIIRTWKWKEQYGNRIIDQLKRLGASCDWSRERFTMDESYSKAVRRDFVQLYHEGLIYRDKYIVNWCPRCFTALADIEVEYKEQEGNLYYVKYMVKDSNDYITVATTRPETILGDTAVAVHPEDARYKDYVGQTVILPILGREIPVIADDYVSPEFGTGALKVTPAHDPHDFEIGQRHDLERVSVFTPEGRMNKEAGPYNGMDRYEARKAIIKDLEERGLLVKVEPMTHSVGHCYRCDTTTEPYLSTQWFMLMQPFVGPAIKAVEEGLISFTPAQWTKTYFDWMYNIRDWCISRQIWWGHQIPAWYCKDCDEIIVAEEVPSRCTKCDSTNLEQESDVLDTWFSSALWPFATLGWPEETDDLKYFYPTSLLVTSHDIIFFWVARMIMMGLHFMHDIPFSDVYIHALVRDEFGRKMSKSRGNVIDPLDIIEEFGTDALRFTLSSMATPGRDIFLSRERIEGYRNFANKLWNASRFVLMNLSDFTENLAADLTKLEASGELGKLGKLTREADEFTRADLELADRWILSRLNRITMQVDDAIEARNFAEASRLIYDFLWSDFADWYIELAKPRLYQKEDLRTRLLAQSLLVNVLDHTLRLLHPFMPFITEEIWQRITTISGSMIRESIVVAPWPKANTAMIDAAAESDMGLIQSVTSSIRSIKSVLGIALTRPVKVLLNTPDENKRDVLNRDSSYIKELAWVENLVIGANITKPEHSAVDVEQGIEIFMPLEGLVDIEEERRRLEKELAKTEADAEKSRRKLANPQFLEKAAPQVVDKEKAKLAEFDDKIAKLKRQLESL